VVAAVAYQQLSHTQQEKAAELLKHHPEFSRKWNDEFKKTNGISLGAFLMMKASTWPDEIRNGNHPHNHLHHPEWHYINYKINFEHGHNTQPIDGSKEPNVVWALRLASNVLRDRSQDNETRAIYLAWLIHLAGDIHQPLHCGSLF